VLCIVYGNGNGKVDRARAEQEERGEARSWLGSLVGVLA
jgi:hypothetical protein